MATREQQLAAIMTAESGGRNVFSNITVPGYTKEQTGSGYYQIIPSTWRQGAAWAGVDVSQYPLAINAPYAVQTQVANALIDRQGLQPWSGPGGKTLTYVNQIDAGMNPKLVTGPVDGGGGGTATTMLAGSTNPNFGYSPPGQTFYQFTNPDGSNGMTSDPSMVPPGSTNVQPLPQAPAGANTGTPQTGPTGTTAGGAGMPGVLPPVLTGGPLSVGITPGLAGALQSDVTSTQQTAKDIAAGAESATGSAFRGAFSGLLGGIENWAARWFLVAAALVLIAIALWRIVEPNATPASMGRRLAKAA